MASLFLTRFMKSTIVPCYVAQLRKPTMVQTYSRAFQTSCLNLNLNEEAEDKPASGANFVPRGLQLNRVTLMGHLHEEPYPFQMDDRVTSYKLTIRTEETFNILGEKRLQTNYFTAICRNKALFPIIENSHENDRVFVHGRLTTFPLQRSDDKKHFATQIAVAGLEILSKI